MELYRQHQYHHHHHNCHHTSLSKIFPTNTTNTDTNTNTNTTHRHKYKCKYKYSRCVDEGSRLVTCLEQSPFGSRGPSTSSHPPVAGHVFMLILQMIIIPSPSLRNEVETVRWCNKLNVTFALFQGEGLAIQVACLLPVSLGSQLSHYHLDKTEPAMPHISSWPSWCHDDDDSNGHQTIITIKIKQILTHAAQTKHTLSSVRCKDVYDKDKGS